MNVALLKVIKTSRVNRVLKQKRKNGTAKRKFWPWRLWAQGLTLTIWEHAHWGIFLTLQIFIERVLKNQEQRKKETIVRYSAFLMWFWYFPCQFSANKRNRTLIIIPALLCGPKKENQTFHQSLYNKLISSWLVCELALHFELQAKRAASEHATS